MRLFKLEAGESTTDSEVCKTVKRNFKREIAEAVAQTSKSGLEYGFAVCGNVAGPLSQGGRQAVLIPNCSEGPTTAMIHSHNSSPELEEKLGERLAAQYMGYPSSHDLTFPTNDGQRFWCVASKSHLTCFNKARNGPTRPITELTRKEHESGAIMNGWSNGQLSDAEARKQIRSIVRAQRAAMKSTGGYCSVNL